jgi:methenyltetrahydromethanopterin cyclohydrolase
MADRLPSSASRDHGEPFGKVLERAGWDFYAIDPLLFSPAEVRLVSVETGRSFHAGAVEPGVLERSFRG